MRVKKKNIHSYNGKRYFYYNENLAQNLMKELKISFPTLINEVKEYKGLIMMYNPTNTI